MKAPQRVYREAGKGIYTCDTLMPTYRTVSHKRVEEPLIKVKTITDDPNIFWIVCGNFEAPILNEDGSGIYTLIEAKKMARSLFHEKPYTIFCKSSGEQYVKTVKSKKETDNG